MKIVFLQFLLASFSLTTASTLNAAEWQISPCFPPDKSGTWTFGIDVDGWKLAHDALRGEIRDFQHALNVLEQDQVPPTRQQSRALRRWWNGHVRHTQSHHKNEDRIVKSFVEQRFVYPAFMEDDHVKIDHHLETISELTRRLSSTRAAKDRTKVLKRLREAFEEYVNDFLPHLQAEEDLGIPLTRAYFSPQEVRGLTNRLASRGPGVETGAIVHYVGREKLNHAMQLQNVPNPRVLWVLILNPRHRYYQRHMLRSLDRITKKSR